MSKKRLTFDIDLPEDDGVEAPAPSASSRRGPMAAAISENAGSLRDRRNIEEQIRAENDALAAEHVRIKRLGLIVDLVPLDEIETWKLTRDRAKGDDYELSELVTSIREVGLSNPIRLEIREDGRYELIQGYRRLSAYRALLEETGDQVWASIPAGILPRGEGIELLYRRMVDENLVRKDISFGEMATLALNYARDPSTSENDPEKAVAQLFQSAGYQKRSYIRGFIKLVDRLGDDLRFVQHVPRALGLKLAAAIEERPESVPVIRAELRAFDNRSVMDELDILRRATGVEDTDDGDPVVPRKKPAGAVAGKAKTTFQVASRIGSAKCTAANGRLEIRLDRDFSALDRRKLEASLKLMLDQLE